MPREKVWESDAERMRAKRAKDEHDRRRDADAERGGRAVDPDDDARTARAVAYARWREEEQHAAVGGLQSEQDIRDFYGYAASETRTRAERDAAAVRMVDWLQRRRADATAPPDRD